MERVKEKCDITPIVIYYFYSNKGDCEDCSKQGYVLTRVGREYPAARIYAFDYNLDLSALRTLIAIHGVENTLPALIIDDSVHYGFNDFETLAERIPSLMATTSASTSSNRIKQINRDDFFADSVMPKLFLVKVFAKKHCRGPYNILYAYEVTKMKRKIYFVALEQWTQGACLNLLERYYHRKIV